MPGPVGNTYHDDQPRTADGRPIGMTFGASRGKRNNAPPGITGMSALGGEFNRSFREPEPLQPSAQIHPVWRARQIKGLHRAARLLSFGHLHRYCLPSKASGKPRLAQPDPLLGRRETRLPTTRVTRQAHTLIWPA